MTTRLKEQADAFKVKEEQAKSLLSEKEKVSIAKLFDVSECRDLCSNLKSCGKLLNHWRPRWLLLPVKQPHPLTYLKV